MRNKDLQELLATYDDDIDVGTVALIGRQTVTGAFLVGHSGDERLLLQEETVSPVQAATIPTEKAKRPKSNGSDGSGGHNPSPAK